MLRIKVTDVDVRIPVFDANTRSIRAGIINSVSQNRLLTDTAGVKLVDVLTQINLEIRDGDAVGIIGLNGSGKTSLLRLLSKIYEPTRGTVSVQGKTRSLLSLGAGLEVSLTGRENIKRLLYLYGESASYNIDKENEIIDFSGLQDSIDLPVRTYSAGMTMRLMFSTLVSSTPDIFILDEFFSTGDEEFSLKAERKMAQLVDNANVFVFSSHAHDVIKAHCNRFIHMDRGRATEIGVNDF